MKNFNPGVSRHWLLVVILFLCSSFSATLSIAAPPTITNPPLTGATIGTAYTPETFSASGGTAPYTFAITAGALPPGMTLSANGMLSGTPTAVGLFNFTVRATDNLGNKSTPDAVSLTVAPVMSMSPVTVPNGMYKTAYTPLTFTASGGTAPYTYVATGLPAAMTVSPGGVLTGTPTIPGTYTVQVTATDNSNPVHFAYTKTYSLVISKAPLTITANPANSMYGSPLVPNGSLSVSYAGFKTGDGPANLTTPPVVTNTATAGANAGTYQLIPSGAVSPNYTMQYVNGIYTINPAPLSILATNKIKAYGSPLPPLTATYTGFVNGDNAASLTKQPILSTNATASSSVGTYTITASGAVDPNYIITYTAGTLRILPRTLTVMADDQTMNYGGTVPNFTIEYFGWVNGDTALAVPARATTSATSASPAGYYSIDPSGASDPNYTFTYISGTLTINPDSLTVSANAQTKTYGTSDPALTYSVTGLVNGDNNSIFTGSLTRDSGENVGTYAITEGTLSAGNNYIINFTGNNLTITKASQQISWAQNMLAGCNGVGQLQLSATSSSGLPITYTSSDSTVANITGDQLTVAKWGSSIITASQPGDSNYLPATPVTDTVISESSSLVRQHWSDALFFDNTSNSYVQWQWYKNGSPIQGATGQYYSEAPSLNGQYYVIATNNAGQKVQTCPLDITGSGAIPGGMKVLPNPVTTGGVVTIISNYSAAALQGAQMQIVDMTGRVWKAIGNVQPSMQVNMPTIDGIYVINLLFSSGQKSSVNVLVIK